MDESAEQLVHELHQATAETEIDMSSEEYPPSESPPTSPPQTHAAPSTPSAPSSPSAASTPSTQGTTSLNLTDGIKAAFISGKFSDLIIAHGSEKWKAHKVVVASQSPVFEFMVNHLEDSSTLRLTGYPNEAIKLMMQYLYSGTYATTPSGPDFCLSLHLEVYVLATELQIAGLQVVSSNFFSFNLSNYLRSLDVYFSTIREVYSKTTVTNPALRTALVETAVSEIRLLLTENMWTKFSSVMTDVPEFQRDIMFMMVERAGRLVFAVREELCDQCGPRSDDDGYKVTIACKGCGADKTVEFS